MVVKQAQRLIRDQNIIDTLTRRGYSDAQMMLEYLMYQYSGIDKPDEQIIYEVTGVQVPRPQPPQPLYNYNDPPRYNAPPPQPGNQQTYNQTQQTYSYSSVDFKTMILPILIVAIIMIAYYLSPIDEALDAAMLVGDIIQIILTGVGMGMIGIKGVEIGKTVVQRINK